MRTTFRKAGVACGTLVASVALAFSTATGALGANTALVIGGISAGTMSDLLMKPLLDYKFRDQQRVNVQWPAEAAPFSGDITLGESISQGITNLNAGISTQLAQLEAGEKVTVVGLSAGSLVVNEVLRGLATNANAPDKSQLTFVLVADSSRQKLIDKARYSSRDDYTYQPPPEVKYDIIVVTGEYDGLADRPDRWWNLLALANSIAGSVLVHVPMMYTTDPQVLIDEAEASGGSKWVWKETNSLGGTTTHVLIPTAKLPLVQMFPFLAPREAELKAKIDQGYSRNDEDTTAMRTLASTPDALEDSMEAVPAAGESTEEEVSGQLSTTTSDASPQKRDADETTVEPEQEAAEQEAAEQEAAEQEAAEQEAAEQEAAEQEAAEQEAAEQEAAVSDQNEPSDTSTTPSE
ncbi:hypothetical protein HLY00_235 [Mycolicibacterium hippocampi]|uniref:PE-PPE domain-containing protein n=1 Tax=Mycolicibacterium hippocampi TaxID=659824 RepID=A0A850PN82_9MYCO|nr:hypothetical protein [Mycolicibacterium hippocampi]